MSVNLIGLEGPVNSIDEKKSEANGIEDLWYYNPDLLLNEVELDFEKYQLFGLFALISEQNGKYLLVSLEEKIIWYSVGDGQSHERHKSLEKKYRTIEFDKTLKKYKLFDEFGNTIWDSIEILLKEGANVYIPYVLIKKCELENLLISQSQINNLNQKIFDIEDCLETSQMHKREFLLGTFYLFYEEGRLYFTVLYPVNDKDQGLKLHSTSSLLSKESFDPDFVPRINIFGLKKYELFTCFQIGNKFSQDPSLPSINEMLKRVKAAAERYLEDHIKSQLRIIKLKDQNDRIFLSKLEYLKNDLPIDTFLITELENALFKNQFTIYIKKISGINEYCILASSYLELLQVVLKEGGRLSLSTIEFYQKKGLWPKSNEKKVLAIPSCLPEDTNLICFKVVDHKLFLFIFTGSSPELSCEVNYRFEEKNMQFEIMLPSYVHSYGKNSAPLFIYSNYGLKIEEIRNSKSLTFDQKITSAIKLIQNYRAETGLDLFKNDWEFFMSLQFNRDDNSSLQDLHKVAKELLKNTDAYEPFILSYIKSLVGPKSIEYWLTLIINGESYFFKKNREGIWAVLGFTIFASKEKVKIAAQLYMQAFKEYLIIAKQKSVLEKNLRKAIEILNEFLSEKT